MNEFESQISSIPTETLDALFDNDGAGGNPKPDDIIIGKEKANNLEGIEQVENNDDLFDDGKPKEEVKKEEKPEEKKDADGNIIVEKKEEKVEPKKDEKPEEVISTDLSPEQKEVLKSTVDFLVESGQWVDFEGRADLDMTQELYAEITAEQDRVRLSSQFDELVDSTGNYGKAIIEHIKKGGNPDDIIDIFKEQKQLEQINTTTEDGKQTLISKYYKDVVGWSDAKVEKEIKRLIADNELDTEFTDVEKLYDKHYQQRLEAINKDAEVQEQKVKLQKENFKKDIKTALEKEDTLTPKERKLIESAILDFKHDVGGGQKVNDFYIKFAEIQKDPAKFIKLVRFSMDMDGYEKTLQSKSDTKAAATTFKFVKGNSAVAKMITSPKTENTTKTEYKGTNFSI